MEQFNCGQIAGKRILVAEDDRVGAAIIKRLLEIWTVEFDIASTGEEAVSKVTESLFDLVLMDVEMPGMGGCNAAILIRGGRSVKNPLVPIIGLSAHSSEKEFQRCMHAGMNDYISKPFDPANLFAKLLTYL